MQPDIRKRVPELLNLDWQTIREVMKTYNPKDDCWYMLTINKGQTNEWRTPFLTYRDAIEIVFMALEQKKLRIATHS